VGWFSIINSSGPEIALLGVVKGPVRLALGMPYMEIAQILLLIVNICFLWISFNVLMKKITILGNELAQVIENATDLMPDLEMGDVDPIKMAIAGWIQSASQRAANTTTAQIIPLKDESGKFVKNE